MFVTNHVLSGVLVGRAMERRPVAAFLVGVGSHLLLDSVPHWGCDFSEEGAQERFLSVARWDGMLGLATMAVAAMAVDRRSRTATIAAMAGAAFLDLDKPMLHLFGFDPFPGVVSRLHRRIQNESTDGMPKEFAYGALFASSDIVATIVARRRLRFSGQVAALPS
jgi:hypothetical protein